jgi:hypothetical protein
MKLSLDTEGEAMGRLEIIKYMCVRARVYVCICLCVCMYIMYIYVLYNLYAVLEFELRASSLQGTWSTV